MNPENTLVHYDIFVWQQYQPATVLLLWKPISNNITFLKYLTKAKICFKSHTSGCNKYLSIIGKRIHVHFLETKLHFHSSPVLALDSSPNHFVGFLFVLGVVSLLLLFIWCTDMGFCCKVVGSFWAIDLHDQEYEIVTTGTVHHHVFSRCR